MRIMTMPDAPPAVADPLTPFVPAVARYLGLSRSTAERMAKRKEVAVVQLGRRLLIRHSELNRLIESAEARTITPRKDA